MTSAESEGATLLGRIIIAKREMGSTVSTVRAFGKVVKSLQLHKIRSALHSRKTGDVKVMKIYYGAVFTSQRLEKCCQQQQ
jgi:hypothetical protein